MMLRLRVDLEVAVINHYFVLLGHGHDGNGGGGRVHAAHLLSCWYLRSMNALVAQ